MRFFVEFTKVEEFVILFSKTMGIHHSSSEIQGQSRENKKKNRVSESDRSRRESTEKVNVIKVNKLELNQLTREVKRDNKVITLTAKEYALLEYFMLNADQVITRTMISEHVWQEDFDSFTNVIDVYVKHLRNKIDKGFTSSLIKTIRGVGYVMKK